MTSFEDWYASFCSRPLVFLGRMKGVAPRAVDGGEQRMTLRVQGLAWARVQRPHLLTLEHDGDAGRLAVFAMDEAEA